jgi:hypothetical protein
MSAKTWQQMRQQMDEARAAKGLPPRTDRDRQADLDRIRQNRGPFNLPSCVVNKI